MYGALITTGAELLGSALRGSGPEFKGDPETRRRQAEQLRRYQDMQAGKGPSLGRMALQQGLQQATSQQQAMAASARGGPLQQRLAQRTSQMAGAQMAGRANQAAAQMRAQEQMAAMGEVDRGLRAREAQHLRDYQLKRQEFDRGSRHLQGLIGGTMRGLGSIMG